jgi:predicted acyltransferase
MRNRRTNGSNGNIRKFFNFLTAATPVTTPDNRIRAIDLARGIAVSLMILSHGVNGLLPFDDLPEWGRRIHLFTKFSSSLFIIVFGVSLSIAYLPHVGTDSWPRRRIKMLLNGVVILFWYKVLTVVEMIQFFEPQEIVDTLLFRSFPSFVEILGFYAIALIWVPFFLPVWKKSPFKLRMISPLLFIVINLLLARYFDFWGIEQLEAILIEHEDHYTWGQIARAPLVMVGLILGEFIIKIYNNPGHKARLSGLLALCSMIMFAILYILITPETYNHLIGIARNVGKHPPELQFMLFSVGGAVIVLSICLIGGNRLASIHKPITIVGTNALMAFIFHIFVIFIIFRYLLGYWQNISYNHALILALLLIPATAIWIKLTSWIRRYR